MFNFDTHKGLTVKNKSLLIKNNKKREAALKNEAGGDEKYVFFTWPYKYNKTQKKKLFQ